MCHKLASLPADESIKLTDVIKGKTCDKAEFRDSIDHAASKHVPARLSEHQDPLDGCRYGGHREGGRIMVATQPGQLLNPVDITACILAEVMSKQPYSSPNAQSWAAAQTQLYEQCIVLMHGLLP